jgi:hypothetical protein
MLGDGGITAVNGGGTVWAYKLIADTSINIKRQQDFL